LPGVVVEEIFCHLLLGFSRAKDRRRERRLGGGQYVFSILPQEITGCVEMPVMGAAEAMEEMLARHLANLYAKMDVGSRGEATRKALSEGWFTARDVTQQENIPLNSDR
jgi:hypothetical protein